MDIAVILITSLACLVVGVVVAYIVLENKSKNERKQREKQGDEIIEAARNRAKEIKYNAKNEAKLIIKEDRENLEHEFKNRQKQIHDQEKEISKKEIQLDQKLEETKKEHEKIKAKEADLDTKNKKIDETLEKFKKTEDEYTAKLMQVSQMTKEQVKQELVDIYTEEAKVDAAQLIRKIEEEAHEDAEKRAKRIIGIAIQRFAGEYVAEQTISTVELANDDIKGRLIGREGRNIRAFEQICGVDLVIDDTPGIVVISSFNVVRKEIARMTIERLIADGRIHPAKIEEFYEKAKVHFDARLKDLGEKAQMEIGIHGIHPEILKMFGALNWRTSYMQNQYQHSLEVAFICGSMAAELGINVKQARRAGLLHDIGKVMDASQEGSHAMVGADFLKKYGEAPDIVHAVRAHHEDVKPETLLAHLVMAADALSGGRPGVRKFLKESYVTRLSDIENIVNSFEGVSKSYAISAGREIRVLVENEKINDEQTVILSRDIAKKIEEEMSYPGSIKVSVIRETRAVGFAR
ncbi:MAG: ribonuclease Y [Bacteriovoracaceae bacterium]|nr:ribonuclease Y [Bacteriovoracaceae bacterium]